MNSRRADLLWMALRWALGVLFVAASYHKILSPSTFAHEVNNYKLLPAALVNPFAIILPWLELFCGLALLVNRFALGAAWLVAVMTAAFCGAVGAAVARHLNIACGCFKSGGSPATWLTFGRDLLILVAAVVHLVRAQRNQRWTSPI